jgi:hypothetical protein
MAVSIAVLLAGSAATAVAQSSQAAATAQFDQGRALMKQHKYEAACAAFDTSQKLDPQLGTQFNLAECNAHIGKLASAWLGYRDLAQRDTNAGRRQESQRRARELEKRLPRLLVRISDPPAGLAVSINGRDATSLVGIESPVDLGDYQIRATAPGFAAAETSASVTDEGKTVKVHIALTRRDEPAAPSPTTAVPVAAPTTDGPTDAPARPTREPATDEPAGPVSHRRRNGALIAIAGGGLVVTGAVFGLSARSSWNDAQALCPDRMCATAGDKQRGDSLVDSARTSAAVSTALVIGGAVITAAGIYLVTTAHPAQTTAFGVSPTNGGAVVVLGGQF